MQFNNVGVAHGHPSLATPLYNNTKVYNLIIILYIVAHMCVQQILCAVPDQPVMEFVCRCRLEHTVCGDNSPGLCLHICSFHMVLCLLYQKVSCFSILAFVTAQTFIINLLIQTYGISLTCAQSWLLQLFCWVYFGRSLAN